MKLENDQDIFNLFKMETFLPHEKSEIEDCILSIIEGNEKAVDRLIILTGANLLDRETEKTIRKNITEACATVAEKLGKDIKKIRVNRMYGKKAVNESSGDPDINKLAKQIPVKKNEFCWNRGFGSDPMKESKTKARVSDHWWKKSGGLSPLSGKKYGGKM